MVITENSSVKVHYTGKLEDNTVFDSSLNREPLDVKLGQGVLIPGFEQGLQGLAVGDKKTVTIPFTQAYGPVMEERKQEVPKQFVPEGVQVGQKLAAQGPDGEMYVTVAEVKEETVVLDGNHPLAGKNLIFDLEVVEIY